MNKENLQVMKLKKYVYGQHISAILTIAWVSITAVFWWMKKEYEPINFSAPTSLVKEVLDRNFNKIPTFSKIDLIKGIFYE